MLYLLAGLHLLTHPRSFCHIIPSEAAGPPAASPPGRSGAHPLPSPMRRTREGGDEGRRNEPAATRGLKGGGSGPPVGAQHASSLSQAGVRWMGPGLEWIPCQPDLCHPTSIRSPPTL
ncbi:unnamed protein product [Lota lota]